MMQFGILARSVLFISAHESQTLQLHMMIWLGSASSFFSTVIIWYWFWYPVMGRIGSIGGPVLLRGPPVDPQQKNVYSQVYFHEAVSSQTNIYVWIRPNTLQYFRIFNAKEHLQVSYLKRTNLTVSLALVFVPDIKIPPNGCHGRPTLWKVPWKPVG